MRGWLHAMVRWLVVALARARLTRVQLGLPVTKHAPNVSRCVFLPAHRIAPVCPFWEPQTGWRTGAFRGGIGGDGTWTVGSARTTVQAATLKSGPANARG